MTTWTLGIIEDDDGNPVFVEMLKDKQNVFILVDGVTIAQRGSPGTSQAETWVSLEPGWEVVEDAKHHGISVSHNHVSLH